MGKAYKDGYKSRSKQGKRMEPYVGSNHAGEPKFKGERDEHGNEIIGREEARNANRSRKKSARQEGKKFMEDDTYNDD